MVSGQILRLERVIRLGQRSWQVPATVASH